MKKKIAAIVLVSTIGFTAAGQAVAGWGGKGRAQQYQDCPVYSQQMQQQRPNMPVAQIDPAVQEKLDKFFADNKELQKSIIVKGAELKALMRADNPDYKLAGKLSGDLFDLRETLRANAEAAEVDQYLGRGFGMGRGPGMGMGPDDDFRGKRGKGQGMGQGRF